MQREEDKQGGCPFAPEQANDRNGKPDEKKQIGEDSEEYIRENPLQAVGIALAAGFVLGLVIRR